MGIDLMRAQVRQGAQEIVLDTNALLMPMQFGVDLQDELERLLGGFSCVIPSGVMEELTSLGSSPGDGRAALALARSLIKNGRAREVAPGTKDRAPVDEQVIEVAAALGAPVLTNDRGLIASLKERGMRVVRMKGKSHLDFD
jgi:rRNA-processing protein FCF1